MTSPEKPTDESSPVADLLNGLAMIPLAFIALTAALFGGIAYALHKFTEAHPRLTRVAGFACVAFAVCVFSLLAYSHAEAGGRRGAVKVGKREFFQGTASVTNRRGDVAEGVVTTAGRKVKRGTLEGQVRDFGPQEIIHGPRDDRSIMERAIDQQRQPGPYSAGGGGYAGPQTYAAPLAQPQQYYAASDEYYVEESYVEEGPCMCHDCIAARNAAARASGGHSGPQSTYSQSSDFGTRYQASGG